MGSELRLFYVVGGSYALEMRRRVLYLWDSSTFGFKEDSWRRPPGESGRSTAVKEAGKASSVDSSGSQHVNRNPQVSKDPFIGVT